MAREGSKEECFKGEGGNSSESEKESERKRIKDHEKEAKRVTLKDQEGKTEREKESGETSFISVPQEMADICCLLCRGE